MGLHRLFALASWLSLHLATTSGAPHIGSDRELPGPEIVRVNVSEDGKAIAIGIRSHGRNAILLGGDGSVLTASRVDAVLPEVACGRGGRSLLAVDDRGVCWEFNAGPAGGDAKLQSWTTCPDQCFRELGLSSTLWPRRSVDSLSVWRPKGFWAYEDWARYQTIEDFQHPRRLAAFAQSASAEYLAMQWWSVFTFRRQPTKRPEASTVQLLEGFSGRVVFEKSLPVRLLAVNGDGHLLCLKGPPANPVPSLAILGRKGELNRNVGLPDLLPSAGLALEDGSFLVGGSAGEEPQAYRLDPQTGKLTPFPVARFTNAAPLSDGRTIVGSMSGGLTLVSQSGTARSLGNIGGPANVHSMPDGTFLAATTAAVARFAESGKKLWQTSLAQVVPGEWPRLALSPEKEIRARGDPRAEESFGLLADEGSSVLASGAEKSGHALSIQRRPSVLHQVVLRWHGELQVVLSYPGGDSSRWEWPSAGSRAQVGAILFEVVREQKEIRLEVSGEGFERAELRAWQPASANLGRASAPSLTGGGEDVVADVRLWLFNRSYYAQMMGTRPKDADTKWRPASVPARALADGKTGRRIMPSDLVPWWYEITFKSPRTVSALVAFEDAQSPAGCATEGFVTGLVPGDNEWKVLARFRGATSVGRALRWKPVRLGGIRYHVTRGGSGCTEVMLFGPEDSAELEEMEAEGPE